MNTAAKGGFFILRQSVEPYAHIAFSAVGKITVRDKIY